MLGECIHQFVTGYGLPFSLFLAGLAGGFTHCTFMCSPFVLAQTQENKGSVQPFSRLRQSLLLPYHFGRLTTYVLLAVLFGSVLNLALLFQPVRAVVVAPLLLLAALTFLVSAFPGLGKVFPWAARVRFSVPFRWVSRFYQPLVRGRDVASRYALGLLLGFMPCGLVASALMASVTAPTGFQAGVAMAAFGLGTVPALVVVSFGGGFFDSFGFLNSAKVKQGFMVFSALWLVLLAGVLVF